MLQRRKKYKNRTILGYKTLATGKQYLYLYVYGEPLIHFHSSPLNVSKHISSDVPSFSKARRLKEAKNVGKFVILTMYRKELWLGMFLIDFIAKMWIWCLQCSEFSSLKFYKITRKGPLTNNSKPQKLVANRRVAEQWTVVQFTNKSWIHIVIVTLQHYRSLRRIILQGPLTQR